jgi:hypothetical protein
MITVATLRAAGLSDSAIVKVLEIEQKERNAARREQNRINKQNQRARQHVSADVADCADTVNALSLEVSKKESFSEERKKDSKKDIARGSFCPSDFQATEGHYRLGEALSLSHQQVDDTARAMVEWSVSNRNRAVARKADWSLTFNGWLRRNSSAKQTADPQPPMTEAGRELARKTREYEAELERRKGNGQAQKMETRKAANGSGENCADQRHGTLFSESDGFHQGHKSEW